MTINTRRHHGTSEHPTSADTDEWTWRYDGYDAAEEGHRQALCTVGNRYMATRGAAPESDADGTHYPGTYMRGGSLIATDPGRPVMSEAAQCRWSRSSQPTQAAQ
jgi:hypothetical protein